MKRFVFALSLCFVCLIEMSGQVTYSLRYDTATTNYIISMESGTAYSGGLARVSNSSQITIVVSHTLGGYQINNLQGLQTGGTPLNWGFSRIDAPTENATKDYLFFAPSNATSYTPFDIPANTSLDLFSFQSNSGCLGDTELLNNTNDPLLANSSFNAAHNFVVLGGGTSSQYINNLNASASCNTAQVSYCLTYDNQTQRYIVSMRSSQAYSGGLARLTGSAQVSIVAPHTAGGYQITNLTDLQGGTTPLDWGMNRIDAPTENTSKDYLFFAPTNAISYSPFEIEKDSTIELFSFQSASGCLGDLSLFDNDIDPLNSNVNLNPDNSMVVIGGGLQNQYSGNLCPTATCSTSEISYCITFDSLTQRYIVSMRSNQAYSGGLARLTGSSQVSIVAPHTAGGYQITNLTDLQAGGTPLDWGFNRIDAPTENTNKDYLFFAPTNSISYTPFDIPKDTTIELFSFQSGSGCLGDIALFDNDADPLNSNLIYNPDNSISIIGTGATNVYNGNCNVGVTCEACISESGVLSH